MHRQYGPRVTYRMHHLVPSGLNLPIHFPLQCRRDRDCGVSHGCWLGWRQLGTCRCAQWYFCRLLLLLLWLRNNENFGRYGQTLPFIIGLGTRSLSTRCSCSVVCMKIPIRPGLHHHWGGRYTNKCRMPFHPTYRWGKRPAHQRRWVTNSSQVADRYVPRKQYCK